MEILLSQLTPQVFSIMYSLIQKIQKNKKELEKLVKEYRIVKLLDYLDKVKKILNLKEIGFYNYVELRKLFEEIIDHFETLESKTDLREIIEISLNIKGLKEAKMCAKGTIVLLWLTVLYQITQKLSDESLFLLRNLILEDTESLDRIIRNSRCKARTKQQVISLISQLGDEIENRLENIKAKIEITEIKLEKMNDLIESIPKKYKKIINDTLILIISFLSYQEHKYNIEYCQMGEFILPLSYETILINAMRFVDEPLETLKEYLDFLLNLLKTYIEIKMCNHKYAVSSRIYYPKFPCEYKDLSEVYIRPGKTINAYFRERYSRILKEADLSAIKEKVLGNIESFKDLLLIQVIYTVLQDKEIVLINDEETYNAISLVLNRLFDSVLDQDVSRYVIEIMIEYLKEDIKVDNLFRNLLPSKSFLWCQIFRHVFTSYRCNTYRNLLISDFLKEYIVGLLQSINERILDLTNIYLDKLRINEHKILRILALRALLDKGDVQNAKKYEKAIKDLIEHSMVMVHPYDNRVIKTPDFDSALIKNEADNLEKEIHEEIYKILEEKIKI